MSNKLKTIITNSIKASAEQRITFAEYMNLALYHPNSGYYSSGKVKIGSRGDFFTSPSLGAYFGELLAVQFRDMWENMACPVPFILVEMGAGSGILAQDILYYLENHYPDLLQVFQYVIVEEAPALITQQQQFLQPWLGKKINISWKGWQEISAASITGCCFSNELVDAFPVHQVILEKGKLREIYVTIGAEGFKEVRGELSTPQLEKYFALVGVELPTNAYREGYRTEVNLAALDWLKTVGEKLHRGYLLTIDYGYPAVKYYHPQREKGTLLCYYEHRRHQNPYVNIGKQDITTHVDFTALEREGEKWGLTKVGFTHQALFLMALGLGDRLAALSQGMLNFQQVLKRRDALHQLIDPMGLGKFGVLIQSKGLQNIHRLKGLTFNVP